MAPWFSGYHYCTNSFRKAYNPGYKNFETLQYLSTDPIHHN